MTFKHDPGCMAGPEGQNHCHAHGCATPPSPSAPVVHDNDGKGRPVCGAELNRGDSVGRSGITCRACSEAPSPSAPQADEGRHEAAARAWLNDRVDARDIDHYRDQSVIASLAALLRETEAKGYARGVRDAEAEVREGDDGSVVAVRVADAALRVRDLLRGTR